MLWCRNPTLITWLWNTTVSFSVVSCYDLLTEWSFKNGYRFADGIFKSCKICISYSYFTDFRNSQGSNWQSMKIGIVWGNVLTMNRAEHWHTEKSSIRQHLRPRWPCELSIQELTMPLVYYAQSCQIDDFWFSAMGVTEAPFVNFFVSKIFYLAKVLVTFLIIFILDRCHCSWAAASPAKYERDIQ